MRNFNVIVLFSKKTAVRKLCATNICFQTMPAATPSALSRRLLEEAIVRLPYHQPVPSSQPMGGGGNRFHGLGGCPLSPFFSSAPYYPPFLESGFQPAHQKLLRPPKTHHHSGSGVADPRGGGFSR